MAMVADQTYTGLAITILILPAATGGDGDLSYILPALPVGLTFAAATRIISGTPTAPAATATYTLTAIDVDGNADGRRKTTCGFKLHANTDEDGFIKKMTYTPSNVHDSKRV